MTKFKFSWDSELGRKIVERVNELRVDKEAFSWLQIAEKINAQFGVSFHKEKIRKGWRLHGHGKDLIESHGINKMETKNNNATLEYKNSMSEIHTLDDLLEAFAVDREEWKVDRWNANKWEVGVRDINTGKVCKEPMIQVKAYLSRRVAIDTEFPPVQPVSIRVDTIDTSEERVEKKEFFKCLIVPDAQIGYTRDLHSHLLDPFHDRRVLYLAYMIARETRPDVIVFLGDMLDLPDWSDKYLRSPEFYWTTQPALIEMAWWMGLIRACCPDAQMHYLEGNHENRMNKSVIKHLIAAYDLKPVNNLNAPPAMSIESLAGLRDLNIHYHGGYPRSEVWLNNSLRCVHGDIARKGGGKTSSAILQSTMVNEIVGHVHRFELSRKTILTQGGAKSFTVFSPGTASRIDGKVPSGQAMEDWQQGLGLVYFDNENMCEIVPIAIDDGRCVLEGKVYQSYDDEYVDQMKKDTGWEYF